MASLEDLRGGVIATTGAGSQSEFAVVEALRRLGLERNRDYTTRTVGSSPVRLSALYSGQVEAVPLGVEGPRAGRGGWLPRARRGGQGAPEFTFTTLAAGKSFAAARPDQTAGLLRGVARGMDFIRQDVDRAVELGRPSGLEADPAVARKALELRFDSVRVTLTRERVAAVQAAREIAGTPEDYFDDRYLRQAGLLR